MTKKVEVSIINQPFTFVGEDEEKIRRAAQFVDDKIRFVVKNFGIVNTMNAIVMAMMIVSDEYLEICEAAQNYEKRAAKLLEKVEGF